MRAPQIECDMPSSDSGQYAPEKTLAPSSKYIIYVWITHDFLQERPYHDDSTASRLLSEVKHRRAWLVLRWGTTLESQVLFFFLKDFFISCVGVCVCAPTSYESTYLRTKVYTYLVLRWGTTLESQVLFFFLKDFFISCVGVCVRAPTPYESTYLRTKVYTYLCTKKK